MKPTQAELENLIKIFHSARDQLLETIIKSNGVGTKVYANTVLKQLEKQLKRMEKHSAFYVRSVIPQEYQAALDELYGYFNKNNLLMKPPQAFASLHNDAVHSIAREMQYQIGQGLEQAGRQVIRYVNDARDNVLRQAGLELTGEKLASGGTVQQMRNNLIERLQSEGFMMVQYGEGKNARQVGVDSYASMVARSTTREAGNLARENQLVANGYDLVEMTEHYPTCGICATLQGRVYSISGKDKRFPPLSRAFSSGYRNIHPNCRHSVAPWIESMHTAHEISKAIDKSNRPFEDLRPEEEKALYNKQQVQNRQMRQDKYQYERYKARLGEDAPKSFHAFRKMKKAGGEKWAITQLDYRRRNELVNHPELALPNADKVTAADVKFTKYLFNPENKNGYAKGVAFSSRLGYNIDNWQELQSNVLNRASLYPTKYILTDEHGAKYEQKIIIPGKKGAPANVIVGWKVKSKETWMTTCYIKEVD